MTALAFCAHLLPNEEDEISSDELKKVREALSDLKATLSDATIPDRLRRLIENHINLIEKALQEYPLRGAIALREAGRTALGEVIEAKDEIAAAKNHPSTTKLQKTWDIVNKATDMALKVEQVAQLGQRAWDTISNMLQ